MLKFQLPLMPMDDPFTLGISTLIDAVFDLTGAKLVWKDADKGLRLSQSRAVAVQGHPACMQIKNGDRYSSCAAWCGMPGRGASGRGTCHAGFVQWRWAICHSGSLLGHACLGPFARGHRSLPPPPTARQAAATYTLIQAAIISLAQERSLARGQLDRQTHHPCLNSVCAHLATAPRHSERAADLAARARISPSRLQHLCREELGISLRELRDRMLLDHARRLLLADRPIQTVASQLDFRDQRTFATWFKKRTGYSPSAWRSQAPI